MTIQATTTVGSLKAYNYQANDEKLVYTGRENIIAGTTREEYAQVRAAIALNKSKDLKKPVANFVISLPREQGNDLDFEQWQSIAHDFAKQMGFEKNPYRWDIHGNTETRHMHIFASRVDFEGKCTVKSHNIGRESLEMANKMALSRGWQTATESKKKEREAMLQSFLQSVSTAISWEQLIFHMRQRGYNFELSYKNTGQLNGARITDEKTGYSLPLSKLERKINVNLINQKLAQNEQQQQRQYSYGRGR